MRNIIILLIFILTSAQAFARPLTPAEYSSLNAVVAKYTSDILEKDFDGILEITPDKLIDHISGLVDKPPKEVRKMIAAQTNDVMNVVSINSFVVNLDGLDFTDAQIPDGTTVTYSVIPYSMQITHDGRPYHETTTLLAIHEANQWWLVRFDSKQTELLIAVYPFLKDVAF